MHIDSHRHFRRYDAVRNTWIAGAMRVPDAERTRIFGDHAARFYGLKIRHGLTAQR